MYGERTSVIKCPPADHPIRYNPLAPLLRQNEQLHATASRISSIISASVAKQGIIRL